MRRFLRAFRCWIGFHPLDYSDRGYVGFYYCPRCKKYVEE